jgi:hypothetical protein
MIGGTKVSKINMLASSSDAFSAFGASVVRNSDNQQGEQRLVIVGP